MSVVPPNRIVIDFLEGVTGRADAIAYARGFITSHFDVPEQSGYYVMPYKTGYAFEVHEGGSQYAYLPSILQTIEETPNSTVSVRSGARVLQVSKGPRGAFNSVLLPEELSSYLEDVIETDDKSPSLIPFQLSHTIWLLIGMGSALLGAFIFIICLGFYALDPSQGSIPKSQTTPPDQLPIAQWQNMVSKLNGGNYVAAMRYQNGQWSFEVKSNSNKPGEPDTAPAPVPVPPADSGDSSRVVIMSPDTTPSQAPVPPPPSGAPPNGGKAP